VTPERWSQVRNLFEQVIERPARERTAWLEEHSAGDSDLFAEVMSLLDSHEDSGGLLDRAAPGGHIARAVRALPDPYEGTLIGPYQLLQRVGRGGMGSVYAAARSDGEYRKRVAIKLVTPGFDSEDALRRFRTERQVLASLDHPNIARLLDGGTTAEGLPYLVMEFVEGQLIDEYCRRQGLSLNQRLALFRTTCEAVQYAHQNLVIHRDLKPSNILVTPAGTVKLLDFGIAKLLHPEFMPGTAGLTRAGLRPLTPDYASPEQVRGDPMTTVSDVYSLGVLLYQLLTGRLPYSTAGRSLAEVEKTICDTQPRAPSTVIEGDEPLRKRLHGDLDHILLMALRKEPGRRYASVERFSDDIRRHLAGQPVLAHGDSVRYRVGKFIFRNRLAVSTGTLAILSLIAAVAMSQYYRGQAQQRFRAALDLSDFVVRDLDRAMQSGITEARRKLLKKELDYLGRLSEAARNDAELQNHLIEGYASMGDVQGSLFQAHLGDAGEALKSYRKALEIAQARATADPASTSAKVSLAGIQFRIANLTRYQEDGDTALRQYQEVVSTLEPLAAHNPPADTLSLLTRASLQRATLLSQLGRAQQAVQQAQRSLDWAKSWQSNEPSSSDARLNVAIANEWTGRLMADVGRPAEGAERVRDAVAQYERFAAGEPESVKWKRDLLAGLQNLGDVEVLSGRHKEAADAFRRSLVIAEEVAAADPRDQRAQRDIHTSCARLITPLLKLGRMDEARTATLRALEVLGPLVNSPQPAIPDLYQYSWLLATTPFPALKNPAAALNAARQAVAATREKDPWMLDLLARANYAAGQRSQAAEAERKAIALLPPNVESAMRSEFEANLKRWLAPPEKQ